MTTSSLTLLLIRHGETVANRQGWVCGQLDSPLTDEGRAQAARLGAWVRQRGIRGDHHFTSTLSRAIDTHQLVFPGIAAEAVSAFNETDVGEASCWTFDELHAQEPRFLRQGLHSMLKYPGGECIDDVSSRMKGWLELNVFSGRFRDGETVVIVGHGGTVNCVLHELLRVPLALYPAFHARNATLARVRVNLADRSGVLEDFNQGE